MDRGYHDEVRSFVACVVALTLLLASSTASHAQIAATHPRVLRILFIGNSYTHFHQLRHVVRRVIESAEPGVIVHTQEVTHSGWDLWRHWRSGVARRRLHSAHFTHVVLQGHSLAPLRDRDRTRMTEAAHRFSDVIAHTGAQAILYETWARRSGHRVYRQGEAIDPADMQARIDRTYESIASDTGAAIAPVGDTFRRIAGILPEADLYTHDGSHPSELGTFIAAATLATRIAGVAPQAITYRPYEISREQFDTVQRALAP